MGGILKKLIFLLILDYIPGQKYNALLLLHYIPRRQNDNLCQGRGKYLKELIRGYSENGTLLNTESYDKLCRVELNENNFRGRYEKGLYNDEYNMGTFVGFSAKDNVGTAGGYCGVSIYMFSIRKWRLVGSLIINTNFGSEGNTQVLSIWEALNKYGTLI